VKKILEILIALTLVIVMTIPMATSVNAATQSAEVTGTSGTIYLGGDATTIAEAVSTPYDNKFVQLGSESAIQLKFPGNWYAVKSLSSAADLRINVVDSLYPASAQVSVSADGNSWVNVGVFEDTVNIDIDLDSGIFPPVKYIKVYQNGYYIDPAYPDMGFDLDAVVALNASQIWATSVGAIAFGQSPPPPPPTSLNGVPIYVEGTPPPPAPQTRTTFFPLYTPAGSGKTVNLEAPLAYYKPSDLSYYVFRFWVLGNTGSPPPLPAQTLNQKTLSFSPDADKTANAVYQQIFNLGNINYEGPNINPVGIEHKVWVDLGTLPVVLAPKISGIPVKFKIDGVNSSLTGTVVTDSNGIATFTYTGVNDGRDTIWAFIDSNNNGQFDTGEPRSLNSTDKWWVAHFVTGGGNVKEGKKVAWTFAGMVGVNPEGGAVGSFEIKDNINKLTYQLDQFIVLSFYDGPTNSPSATNSTVRFRGIGTRIDSAGIVDEVTMVIIMQDVKEPGAGSDKIAVELVSVDGVVNPQGLIGSVDVPDLPPIPTLQLKTISGGNFQIHDLP
jgi:hypothetical protein